MSDVTKEELKRAVDVVLLVAEAVRKAKEVPSGTVYAVLTGVVSLSGYERVVTILKNAGLVEEKGHMLRWSGPEVAE